MRRIYALIIWLLFCYSAYSQVDVLKFNHKQFVEGEIKGMENGIISIETSYSDEDFKIGWHNIQGIDTETKFLVELTDGTKYYGVLRSLNEKQIVIIGINKGEKIVALLDVFKLSSLDEKFLDRLSASIELGFDLTKALKSFTTSVSSDCQTETWNSNLSFSNLHSKMVGSDPIIRWEGKLSFNYLIGRKLYPNAMLHWFSNTEMKLKLRQNAQLGLGVYIFRTNKYYWGFRLGLNNNDESYYTYSDSDPKVKQYFNNNLWEVFLGTEANLYDTGDLSFYALITSYISDYKGYRWRNDIQLSCKYDLPLDFYIKMSISYNRDNHPPIDISKNDYVFNTGFGWEW